MHIGLVFGTVASGLVEMRNGDRLVLLGPHEIGNHSVTVINISINSQHRLYNFITNIWAHALRGRNV